IPEEIFTTASRAWSLRVQTAGKVGNAGHRLYLPHKLTWNEAECGVRHQRVHDIGYPALNSHSPVEAKPGSIQEVRIEDVLLMERHELAPRCNVRQQLVKCIRLDDVRVVAHKRAGDTISGLELVIEFDGDVIFRCHLLTGEAKNSGISIPEERSIR